MVDNDVNADTVSRGSHVVPVPQLVVLLYPIWSLHASVKLKERKLRTYLKVAAPREVELCC